MLDTPLRSSCNRAQDLEGMQSYGVAYAVGGLPGNLYQSEC
jgi:hypothetical protein